SALARNPSALTRQRRWVSRAKARFNPSYARRPDELRRPLAVDQLLQNALVAHRADIDRQDKRIDRGLRVLDDPLLRLDHRSVLLLEGETTRGRDLLLDLGIKRVVGGLHVEAYRGEEIMGGLVALGREHVDGVVAGAALRRRAGRTD